jgi:hypothetical protein
VIGATRRFRGNASFVACWAVILFSGCSAPVAPRPVSPAPVPALDEPWIGYWRSHGVAPAPPRDFLEWVQPMPEIVNLSHGTLSDETVRQWVIADLRRGQGDLWAFCHLRLDLVYANVFGPPRLNGTDDMVLQELSKGAVALDCPSAYVTEAVGVIAIPKDIQRTVGRGLLTDYVVVTRRRSKGVGRQRVLADGTRVPLPPYHSTGELSWQLDTGGIRNDPVVGPLWYQERGWACHIDGRSPLDGICALVAPPGVDKAPPPVGATN